MAAGTPVQEPDFIRRAFRVLNLQAVIGLIVVIVLPYAMSIRIVSDLFADMTAVWVSYSEYVRDEFLRNPGQQAALTLAEQHHVLIGYEDAQGSWYTDGKTVTAIEGDEERPYYQGLARRFNVADGTRLIITFPSEFFAYAVHLRIFLSWAGAPYCSSCCCSSCAPDAVSVALDAARYTGAYCRQSRFYGADHWSRPQQPTGHEVQCDDGINPLADPVQRPVDHGPQP